MVRRWSHAGAVDAPAYRQPAAGPAHPTPRPAHPAARPRHAGSSSLILSGAGETVLLYRPTNN